VNVDALVFISCELMWSIFNLFFRLVYLPCGKLFLMVFEGDG